MAATGNEDEEFLAKCEEELKHRYTVQDEEFTKVFKADPSVPPIIESWWVPQNSGRRNDRRNNRSHLYERRDDRDRRDRRRQDDQRGYREQDRGYNDYNRDRGYDNRRSRNERPRY